MALITKYGTPSLSSPTPSRENSITGLHTAQEIAAGDICTINSDGRIVHAEDATVWTGIAAGDAPSGEALTLYVGVNFHYGQNLEPGTLLYVGADGGLDDAGAEGEAAVAVVLDSTRIRFFGRG